MLMRSLRLVLLTFFGVSLAISLAGERRRHQRSAADIGSDLGALAGELLKAAERRQQAMLRITFASLIATVVASGVAIVSAV